MPSAFVGKIIDSRYRVSRRLGNGSRGVVYAVVDLTTNRQFAFKRSAEPEGSTVDSLLSEAEYLRSLAHPNVPRLYHVGRAESGHAFFIADLIDGPDVANYLQDRPIDCLSALLTIRGVADAIRVLHQQGVLYRDCKPRNILLPLTEGIPRFFNAKLIDFGSARRMFDLGPDGRRRITSGSFDGTIGYMAPEQIAGRPHRETADVFGVGATLFTMLFGELRRTGEEISVVIPPPELRGMMNPYLGEYVIRRLTSELDVPSKPEIPASARELLSSCLRLDPDQRPQSMAEMILKLDAALVECLELRRTQCAEEAGVSSPRTAGDVKPSRHELPVTNDGMLIAGS